MQPDPLVLDQAHIHLMRAIRLVKLLPDKCRLTDGERETCEFILSILRRHAGETGPSVNNGQRGKREMR